MVPACYTQQKSALVQCGSSKSKLGNAAALRPSSTPRTREPASEKRHNVLGKSFDSRVSLIASRVSHSVKQAAVVCGIVTRLAKLYWR